jgi:hypothetical protein
MSFTPSAWFEFGFLPHQWLRMRVLPHQWFEGLYPISVWFIPSDVIPNEGCQMLAT